MEGLQTHKVAPRDSLQKISRLYGIEDWREIAELNGLHSPYIDSVFMSEEYKDDPKVAKVGTILLIPVMGVNYSTPKMQRDVVEQLAYGLDLDLYGDEPVLTEEEGELSYASGDIALAEGLHNLAQQLTIRLSTKEGALLLHPDFGSRLYLYTGKLDDQTTRNKIAFEVERCLRSDFRVKEVRDIEVVQIEGGNAVTATVIPVPPGEPFKLYKYLN